MFSRGLCRREVLEQPLYSTPHPQEQGTGILFSLSTKRKAEIRKTSQKVVIKENSSASIWQSTEGLTRFPAASNEIVQSLLLADTRGGRQQLPGHLFILWNYSKNKKHFICAPSFLKKKIKPNYVQKKPHLPASGRESTAAAHTNTEHHPPTCSVLLHLQNSSN